MPKEYLTPTSLRERAGLTQRDVATALNRTVGTISDWERFIKRPRLSFAETLSLMRLYRCTLEELAIAFDRIDPDEV